MLTPGVREPRAGARPAGHDGERRLCARRGALRAARRARAVPRREPATRRSCSALVCEEDPEKPSTRGARGSRGDLDAIVLKAMRKEPERRYVVGRGPLGGHRAGTSRARPVLARRGSAAYRAGKFVRRHRFGVAATVLVLVRRSPAGVAATLREARRARAAEARAERRFNDVRKLANSFLFEFHDAIRDLPGSTAARALVVQRALEYLDSLAKESSGRPRAPARARRGLPTVGDVQGNPFMAEPRRPAGARRELRQGDRASRARRSPRRRRRTRSARRWRRLSRRRRPAPERRQRRRTRSPWRRRGSPCARPWPRGAPGDAALQMDLSQAWQYVGLRRDGRRKARRGQPRLSRRRPRSSRSACGRDPSDRAVRRSLGQNLYLSGDAAQNGGDGGSAHSTPSGEAENDPGGARPRGTRERHVPPRPRVVPDRRPATSSSRSGNAPAALEDYRRAPATSRRWRPPTRRARTRPRRRHDPPQRGRGPERARAARAEALDEYRPPGPATRPWSRRRPRARGPPECSRCSTCETAELEAPGGSGTACAAVREGAGIVRADRRPGGVATGPAGVFRGGKRAAAGCGADGR